MSLCREQDNIVRVDHTQRGLVTEALPWHSVENKTQDNVSIRYTDREQDNVSIRYTDREQDNVSIRYTDREQDNVSIRYTDREQDTRQREHKIH